MPLLLTNPYPLPPRNLLHQPSMTGPPPSHQYPTTSAGLSIFNTSSPHHRLSVSSSSKKSRGNWTSYTFYSSKACLDKAVIAILQENSAHGAIPKEYIEGATRVSFADMSVHILNHLYEKLNDACLVQGGEVVTLSSQRLELAND
ncbi:hypothetical protein L2E82_30599 [Cichorium intybus]|uniref:Uncharacterized protein n=1 Tax=Cichorium intybus TaxID=13427 RepID=A0ACB9D0T6_CICIN|nr:hypothetical protein L2E82_30599 [Cichorium intybus]